MKFLSVLAACIIFLMMHSKTKVNSLEKPSSEFNEGNLKFMAQVIGIPKEGSSTAITLKNTATGEILELQPPNKFFTLKGFYGKAVINKSGGSTNLISFTAATEQNLEVPFAKIVAYKKDTKCTWVWLDNSNQPICILSNQVDALPWENLNGKTAYGNPNIGRITKIK